MRLKITLQTTNKFIPFEYHGFLQSTIYHALDNNTSTFFHDVGFGKNRIYKMFVFSELNGKYRLVNDGLIFKEPVSFYVSSIIPEFINQLYTYFSSTTSIILGKEIIDILDVSIIEFLTYNDSNEYIINTLSPITSYKTDKKHFTTYFHPKSEDFENSLKDNLSRKFSIFSSDNSNEFFEIKEIIKCKEMKVKYKNSIYPAYTCKMKIHVSNNYLKLLLETGLGSKNSAGFGMVKIIE